MSGSWDAVTATRQLGCASSKSCGGEREGSFRLTGVSPAQGLQSAGSGGESEPETETDGRSVGAGRRGAEAGTAHPEMQPGYETHERLCEQPEISFLPSADAPS